jgi:hypothetical protein
LQQQQVVQHQQATNIQQQEPPPSTAQKKKPNRKANEAVAATPIPQPNQKMKHSASEKHGPMAKSMDKLASFIAGDGKRSMAQISSSTASSLSWIMLAKYNIFSSSGNWTVARGHHFNFLQP